MIRARYQICSPKSSPPFNTFIGDGAYDGEPVSQAVLTHQPNAQWSFHRTNGRWSQPLAIRCETHHVEVIAQQGRLAWQKITGYNLRSYAELAM